MLQPTSSRQHCYSTYSKFQMLYTGPFYVQVLYKVALEVDTIIHHAIHDSSVK